GGEVELEGLPAQHRAVSDLGIGLVRRLDSGGNPDVDSCAGRSDPDSHGAGHGATVGVQPVGGLRRYFREVTCTRQAITRKDTARKDRKSRECGSLLFWTLNARIPQIDK